MGLNAQHEQQGVWCMKAHLLDKFGHLPCNPEKGEKSSAEEGRAGRAVQVRARQYLLGPVLSLGQVLLQVEGLALSSAQPLLSLPACCVHPAPYLKL